MEFKSPVVTSNPLIMAVFIRGTSDSHLPGKELHCVTLSLTENNGKRLSQKRL